MRAHAALENRVAVVQHVLRRDRRGDRALGVTHVLGALFRRNVFEHDLQCREGAPQGLHHSLDKNGFAVEHVDGRVRHFPMHQQRHAALLQRLQRLRAFAQQIGHAGIRIGRRASGVQLHRKHLAGLVRAEDFLGGGIVGQVQRHQWRERRRVAARLGQRRKNPVAVSQRLLGGGHGRLQVGHDDGAGELARGIGHNGFQRRAIAQVQMPIVGAGDGELSRALNRHERLLSLPAACLVRPARRTSRCPEE
ncbi:hypothetical protein D3C85_1202260 [compost metagenome]